MYQGKTQPKHSFIGQGFAGDEWFPSRLAFGKFKGRLYQEAREDAELRAWLEGASVEAEILKS